MVKGIICPVLKVKVYMLFGIEIRWERGGGQVQLIG